MRIIIVGAGFTGLALARSLIDDGNSVTVIDSKEAAIARASSSLDCATMCADGNNLSILEAAGIADCQALVCVTSSDEVNMITCSLVDAVYPNVTKIARVRNWAYYINTEQATVGDAVSADGSRVAASGVKGSPKGRSETKRPLYGIDWMIHPDVEAAAAIVHAVQHGATGETIAFEDSDFVLTRMTVAETSVLCHKKLLATRALTDARFLIAYLESGTDTPDCQITLPSGNTVITAGCVLGVVTHKDETAKLLRLCGTEPKDLRNIAIVGAGRIGTIVAERLISEEKPAEKRKKNWFTSIFSRPSSDRRIVMIDSDNTLCQAASAKLDKKARVFCADATDESFLSEEGVTSFDLAIAATHNHEMNMVLAAFLENLGVGQSVALVESSAFAAIARKLGVDVAVPLRDTVVDSITSHLRGQSVLGVHTVSAGDMQIIECITKNPSVIGKSLKDLSIPGVFLLLLVQRHEEYELPTGTTTLSEGDSLILIVQSAKSQEIIDMFGGTK